VSKKNAPVVIVRKSKRLNRPGHVAAFMLTGGASGIVSAAKAGSNAGYNARTRKLAGEGSGPARLGRVTPASTGEQWHPTKPEPGLSANRQVGRANKAARERAAS
jgi:hypothetical protein